MAAITTAANGNWSATGTWTGGVVPGNGDTVTLNHNVTVDQNVIIGSSPATGGTAAITLGNTKTFTVNAGFTLRLRGDFTAGTSDTITFNAGSSLIFDSSQAATPSSTRYKWQSNASSPITFNGSSGAHCTVTSDTTNSAQTGYFGAAAGSSTGQMTATYTDFSNLGDSSQNWHTLQAGGGSTYSWTNCTFNNCGSMGASSSGNATMNFVMTDCIFTNSANASTVMAHGFSTALTGGTRAFTRCSFDKRVGTSSAYYNWTFDKCYFGGGLSVTALSSNANKATITNSFINYSSTDNIQAWDLTNSYVFANAPATSNVHVLYYSNVGPSVSVTGNVIQYNTADSAGDCILFPSSGTGTFTITYSNNLILPNMGTGGSSSGTLATFQGLGTVTIVATIEHNTWQTDHGNNPCAIAETFAGLAGYLASFKSNLGYAQNRSSTGYVLWDSGSNTTTGKDAVANYVTVADFNGLEVAVPDQNTTTGSRASAPGSYYAGDARHGYGAQTGAFASTPGVHDVIGQDAMFYDRSRDVLLWGKTSGATDLTGTLALLAATPSLIPSMISYVKDGFRPQNPAYQFGHDGAAIGSQPFLKAIRRPQRKG